MRVVYNGPYDVVEVPILGIVVRRGEPIEVRDGDAELLLQQDVWSEVSDEAVSAKAAATKKGGAA